MPTPPTRNGAEGVARKYFPSIGGVRPSIVIVNHYPCGVVFGNLRIEWRPCGQRSFAVFKGRLFVVLMVIRRSCIHSTTTAQDDGVLKDNLCFLILPLKAALRITKGKSQKDSSCFFLQ